MNFETRKEKVNTLLLFLFEKIVFETNLKEIGTALNCLHAERQGQNNFTSVSHKIYYSEIYRI